MLAHIGRDAITAYIDPGAGGLLTQLLLGGMAGIMVIVKLNWRKLSGLLRRHPMAAEVDEPGEV